MHWMRRLGTAVGATLAVLFALAGPALADPPTIVHPGFVDSAITNLGDLDGPTAVQFVPGVSGQFFVAEKKGVVWKFDQPNDPTPTQVIDLRAEADESGDRGLLGMALAPSFTSSGGDMYLLYTVDRPLNASWNDNCTTPPGDGGCIAAARLIRVHVDSMGHAGTPDPLILGEWCQQYSSHSIGTVRFGTDGMLYVSAGEGASFTTQDWGDFGDANGDNVNPCGDPDNEGGALRAQDVRTDGDPAGLDGAVLRLDPATGAAAPGNPFSASGDLNKRRVIAYGFRNPYRFTFRPGTNDIYLGDVGWNTWEEIDKVRTDSGVAANYGWPCFENTLRDELYNERPLCTSLQADQVTQPVFAYHHGTEEEVVPGDQCLGEAGSSISGITFNSGANYPVEYDGALFFADYSRNCIWFMHKGANGDPAPSTVGLFARGPRSTGGPVDLQVMPNGNIAYVFLGWQGDSQVREIRWNGPRASLTASKTTGTFPYDVHFDASGSTGQAITYKWDLDGDGSWDAGETADTADHHYDPPRRAVTVRVQVTDSHGVSAIASVRIAGTNPPSGAKIAPTVPAGGWSVGDRLKFTGSSTDPDGDPLSYTWTATILHCFVNGGCHTHPYTSGTGTSFTIFAPEHDWPSRLGITLQASDGILSTSTSIELPSRPARLTVRATPSPLKAMLGGVTGPSVTKTLIAGAATTISAPNPQGLSGQTYRFGAWSDGDRHLQRTVRPRTDTVLTARFQVPAANAGAPAVTGAARTNATQAASDGIWRGTGLAFSRRWLRCDAAGAACMAIAGATGTAYQPTQADAGHRLRVVVTAANLLGAASATSAPTAVLADRTRPRVRLSGSTLRRLGSGKVPVRVRCVSERCRVKVRGVLEIDGKTAHRTKSVKKALRKGKTRRITVRLSRSLRAQAAAALHAGRTVTVRLDVTATDAASNRAKAHRTVTLH
jgi:glucose/arabinose dehydrogenase